MIINAVCREKPVDKIFNFEEGKEYQFETDEDYISFILSDADNKIVLSRRSFLAYFCFDLNLGQKLAELVSYNEYNFVKFDDGKRYLKEY